MRTYGKNTGRDLKIEDGKKFGRGLLTTAVQDTSQIMLGRGITQKELRLVPYIHYVMTNDRKLDPRKINQEERKIIQKWKEQGHVEGGACGLAITKHFWDFICEILFLAYVAYDNEEVFADKR